MATSQKSATKAQGAKATEKKASTYKNNVIGAHKEFKTSVRSVNQGLKLLKIVLSQKSEFKQVVENINKALKNETTYKKLDSLVKRNKDGLTSPFYILQTLEKINK